MALSGYRLKVLLIVINLSLGLALLAVTAFAQAVYDPEAYRQLADASAGQTIAPGTRITAENWTTYRRFIPLGLQYAFTGNYPIKIGTGPEYVIEVEPTQHFNFPRKFLEDTEKYLGQVQLVQSPTGGFNLAPLPGRTAGLPFGRNPTEPNLGWKILYNNWLTYEPTVSHAISNTRAVDSNRNVLEHSTDITFYHLAHLSEPGLPATLPFADRFLYSQRTMVVTPEQQKYNMGLRQWYQDPERIPEQYSFVPSMRRSLRLSTASRCKPLPGTDFVEDDNGFQLPNFKVTFLGLKKLLVRLQDPVKGSDPAAYELTGSFPGWPKAGTGTWQLRTQYVVEASPLPVMGEYCYSHRVFYIDKETWVTFMNDIYQRDGHFWKLFWPKYFPVHLDDAMFLTFPAGITSGLMLDFKANHATLSVQHDVTIGRSVPPGYQDAERLGFPASLHQVNQ